MAANISASSASVGAAGRRPKPDFVFPNYADHAYAKVALDPVTLEYVGSSLDHIDDGLLRQLVWMAIWEMVRDAQLRSTEFLAICRHRLPDETDLDIVNSSVERATMTLWRFVPDSQRAREAQQMFDSAVTNLKAAGSVDARIVWARAAIAWAERTADIERLIDLADGKEQVRRLQFRPGNALGHRDQGGCLWRERRAGAHRRRGQRDQSDRGRRAQIRAEASAPTREAKDRAWQQIHGDGYGSFHLTRAAMQGVFWANNPELVEPYVDSFFDRLREVFETRNHPFARSYLLTLYPAYRADPRVVDRSRALNDLDGQLPTLSRQLAEVTDELERAIRVRRFAES